MTLPSEFLRFVEKDCPRERFILSYLAERGVQSAVMPTAGRRHICVVFPKSAYHPMFRIKTVLAHYDRAEGSPGANDNSAAVFCMLEWACRLSAYRGFHNVRLILTDGEELASAGVASQGAFALAERFRRLGITGDDVFVFDCTGRGSVPVLARTVLPAGVSEPFRRSFSSLERRTENLLRLSAGGRHVRLPVPYSDNAGFLACGIPAVAVTLLPDAEASEYMYSLARFPQLEDFVMNRKRQETAHSEAERQETGLRDMIPQTWRLIHSPDDSPDSLTPESFSVTGGILDALAAMKTPAS